MKRSLIVIAMLIAIINVKAQNLSFGPVGSVGHSWTSADVSTGTDKSFHPAFSLGGRMVYSFTPSWGVSGDIRFSSEGQTLEDVNGFKMKARANYIRVPLQGIYFFGKYGDRVRPKISIGPSFGFLIGGKTDIMGPADGWVKIKTTDIWKSFDFGVNIAGGGNVRIARSTWLNLELAYYLGLTDVAESGTPGKNRNLGINAGVTFPLTTIMPEQWKR
jgi:hypothetical protein